MEKAVSKIVEFAIWYLNISAKPKLSIYDGDDYVYQVLITNDDMNEGMFIAYLEDIDKYKAKRINNSEGIKVIDEKILTFDELKHYVTEAF